MWLRFIQLVFLCQITGDVGLIASNGLTMLVNGGLVGGIGGGGHGAALGDGVAGGLLDGVGVASDDGDLDGGRRRGQGVGG